MTTAWDHQCLNQLLPSDSPSQFERAAVAVGFPARAADPIKQAYEWVRRRAVMFTPYTPPKPEDSVQRLNRTGQPITWIERKIVRWGLSGNSNETPGGTIVTVQYIAGLLQRTEAEVRDEYNTKQGVKGFPICLS